MRNFSKSLNPKNIDKSVSDIRIRIRLLFESSFWISVSGCKLTIPPDIQPANRIVIISAAHKQDLMKKMHGKNKRIQFLVNQNHGLENMHKNSPKSHGNNGSTTKTTICLIKFSLTFWDTYNKVKSSHVCAVSTQQ